MIGERLTHPEFMMLLDRLLKNTQLNEKDTLFCNAARQMRSLDRKVKQRIYSIEQKMAAKTRKMGLTSPLNQLAS